MKNSKGFTITEMLMAAGLLALALAGAMSFFVYQSQKATDNTRLKAARESIALALMVMQRDIQHAAYGIPKNKTLSMVILSQPNALIGFADVDNKIYVSYGSFLDMTFDLEHKTDQNSVFMTTASKDYTASLSGQIDYDLFPTTMDLTTDTRPLGGFIATTGQAEVDWDATVPRSAGQKSQTFIFKGGTTLPIAGPSVPPSVTVVPAIVYEIALDPNPLASQARELRRNGIRLVGGDPDLEVYNLTVRDVSCSWTPPPPCPGTATQLVYEITLWYQVKLRSSRTEAGLYGTGRRTWHKANVSVRAAPRTVVLNQ